MDAEGLNKIRQGVYPTASTPWLHSVYPSGVLNGGVLASCIYIDHGNRREGIDAQVFSSKNLPENASSHEPHESDDFRDYLREHEPEDYGDVLYLLDMYRPRLRFPELEIDVSPVQPELTSRVGAIIEWILLDSRGHLLWHHQMESIAALFFPTAKARVLLRKGVNGKRLEASFHLHRVVVQEEWALDRVVEQRLQRGDICYTTVMPNCRGAYLLSELLFRGSDHA
jgi:hypothetical protein